MPPHLLYLFWTVVVVVIFILIALKIHKALKSYGDAQILTHLNDLSCFYSVLIALPTKLFIVRLDSLTPIWPKNTR